MKNITSWETHTQDPPPKVQNESTVRVNYLLRSGKSMDEDLQVELRPLPVQQSKW